MLPLALACHVNRQCMTTEEVFVQLNVSTVIQFHQILGQDTPLIYHGDECPFSFPSDSSKETQTIERYIYYETNSSDKVTTD